MAASTSRVRPCGPAVGVVRRRRVHAVVTPAALAREGRDRHQLDRGHPELARAPAGADRGVERALVGERADVELVDHELVERDALPLARRSTRRRRIDDSDGPRTPSGCEREHGSGSVAAVERGSVAVARAGCEARRRTRRRPSRLARGSPSSSSERDGRPRAPTPRNRRRRRPTGAPSGRVTRSSIPPRARARGTRAAAARARPSARRGRGRRPASSRPVSDIAAAVDVRVAVQDLAPHARRGDADAVVRAQDRREVADQRAPRRAVRGRGAEREHARPRRWRRSTRSPPGRRRARAAPDRRGRPRFRSRTSARDALVLGPVEQMPVEARS